MPDATLDPAALGELLETVGGDREFVVELIEEYLGTSPSVIVDLRAGLAAGNAVAVRRAAHTLKSTSANFGASRLATMVRAIEAAAASDDLGALESQVDEAAAEFEAVAIALRAVADEGGPA